MKVEQGTPRYNKGANLHTWKVERSWVRNAAWCVFRNTSEGARMHRQQICIFCLRWVSNTPLVCAAGGHAAVQSNIVQQHPEHSL